MNRRNHNCIRFGRQVRRLREESGCSQEDLAVKASIHRTYIGGIERGERNPTLVTIHKLAEALGVPPKKLLEYTTKP